MPSHGGDETKTTSYMYMSKFLKYAPERAKRKLNLLLTVYILYAVYEERKY